MFDADLTLSAALYTAINGMLKLASSLAFIEEIESLKTIRFVDDGLMKKSTAAATVLTAAG